MSPTDGLVRRPEPVIKCPTCDADIPLSSGWGPVGDKQFRCAYCGELTEACTTIDLR